MPYFRRPLSIGSRTTTSCSPIFTTSSVREASWWRSAVAKGNIASVIEAVKSLGVERAGTWLYATPEETAERLNKAGFVDVQTWAHPEPVPFPDGEGLVPFLETVCLREHLATLPAGERKAFAEAVAAAMPAPVIDYVRLNIVARRDGDA